MQSAIIGTEGVSVSNLFHNDSPTTEKTQRDAFIWCTTLRRQHLLDGSTFALGDAEVHPADTIRNLGVHFDSCMTLTAHVSQLVRGCFYQLRRIKTIRKFIPTSTAVALVNSLIVSRVDYCNSLLAGLPTRQLN